MFQLCKEASSYCSVNVHSQYLTDRMLYRVHLAMSEYELTTSVVIGSDYTGSCKSIYICCTMHIGAKCFTVLLSAPSFEFL